MMYYCVMKILAIETSCDETGISIIDASGSVVADPEHGRRQGDMKFTVLADTLASQAELHSEYGGVYPTLAKREHIKALPLLLAEALKMANITDLSAVESVDAIAVTHGPGLEPALWTGVVFAQELAKKWRVPLVPVNHMEGHIYSALMQVNDTDDTRYSIRTITYPAITLLISGGHTDLVLVRAPFEYEYLGGTLDDAVGEAFDKCARMLGLGYPGGPIIGQLAQKMRDTLTADPDLTIDTGKALPRPMLHSKDSNFSFSGLKTAVLYKVKELHKIHGDNLPQNIVEHIAMEFEDAAAEVLAKKTVAALEEYHASTLIVGGGVSASGYINKIIKEKIEKELGTDAVKIFVPKRGMAGDNALMIAIAGYCRAQRGEYLSDLTELKAHGTLKL